MAINITGQYAETLLSRKKNYYDVLALKHKRKDTNSHACYSLEEFFKKSLQTNWNIFCAGLSLLVVVVGLDPVVLRIARCPLVTTIGKL